MCLLLFVSSSSSCLNRTACDFSLQLVGHSLGTQLLRLDVDLQPEHDFVDPCGGF